MTLEDKCISERTKGCESCKGYDRSCVDYHIDIYGELYDATKIDVVMETYQKLKKVIKNNLFNNSR